MIKTFADKRTHERYVAGANKRFPPDVARRAYVPPSHLLRSVSLLRPLLIDPLNLFSAAPVGSCGGGSRRDAMT